MRIQWATKCPYRRDLLLCIQFNARGRPGAFLTRFASASRVRDGWPAGPPDTLGSSRFYSRPLEGGATWGSDCWPREDRSPGIAGPSDRLHRMAKKKNAPRKRKSAGKKTGTLRRSAARRKKAQQSSKRSRQKAVVRTTRRSPLLTSLDVPATSGRRGFGAHSAGQSGDTQGLSNAEGADSESVEELVEEGQDFEAGVVAGVEDADAAQGEVRTKQVREDDVPLEYLEQDLDRLNRPRPLPRGPATKETATSATRVSRGPVDAPGKRHRKPLPHESVDKRHGRIEGQTDGPEERQAGRPRRATLAEMEGNVVAVRCGVWSPSNCQSDITERSHEKTICVLGALAALGSGWVQRVETKGRRRKKSRAYSKSTKRITSRVTLTPGPHNTQRMQHLSEANAICKAGRRSETLSRSCSGTFRPGPSTCPTCESESTTRRPPAPRPSLTPTTKAHEPMHQEGW